MGKEARKALDDAFKQRAVKDKVIIMENADKCMHELRDYITLLEEVQGYVQSSMNHKHRYYELVMHDTREKHILRLKRILQGLPAIDDKE